MKINSLYIHEKTALFLLASLMAIAGVYAYKMFSFLLPLMTFILIWHERSVKTIPLHLSPPLFFGLLLLAWGGLSIFWADNLQAALSTYTSFTITFICALLFLSRIQQTSPALLSKASYVVQTAGLILLILVISQIMIDTFLRTGDTAIPYMWRMKPIGSILSLTAFVGCGFLWVAEKKALSILTFLLIFLTVVLTRCETACYGLTIATVVFLCSYTMPFLMTRMAMVASYLFLILSPLFFCYVLFPARIATSPELGWLFKYSFFHRVLGWAYYSQKFFENPLFGYGIGSSAHLPSDANLSPGFENLLHPHNNSLQAYTELGLVGGILYAFFFASLFFLIGKHVKDRLSVAICNATVTFGFVAAEITHNLWRNYWLSLVALTTGALIVFLRAREAQLRAAAGHSALSPTPGGEWAPQQS
jgi:O-antigen ligase